MRGRRLSEFPPTYLKDMRNRANENAVRVLQAWGNPILSKEDDDTLKLVSMILVVTSEWRM